MRIGAVAREARKETAQGRHSPQRPGIYSGQFKPSSGLYSVLLSQCQSAWPFPGQQYQVVELNFYDQKGVLAHVHLPCLAWKPLNRKLLYLQCCDGECFSSVHKTFPKDLHVCRGGGVETCRQKQNLQTCMRDLESLEEQFASVSPSRGLYLSSCKEKFL
jgi:hypothetical protein